MLLHICRLSPMQVHISLVLQYLRWFPGEHWIHFEVLVLTFKILCGLGPTYLRNRLLPYMLQRGLHSQDHLLVVPGLRDVCLASVRARAFSALPQPGEITSHWWSGPLWDLLQFLEACKMQLFCKVENIHSIYGLPCITIRLIFICGSATQKHPGCLML